MATPYRIYVVDDHPLIVSGIRLLLEVEADIELVGSAVDGTIAQEQCVQLQPDLLILDLKIPGHSPIEVISTLRRASPRTKVLVMSAFRDRVYLKELQRVGIEGYILKDEAPDLLLSAVRTVLGNATWFSHSVLDMMLTAPPPSQERIVWNTLTQMEQSLLLGIGRGLSNKEIAQELHVAEQTIRNYSSRLYEKLGIPSRSHVVMWLYNNNIKDLPQK